MEGLTIYNRYHVLLYKVLVTILNSEEKKMRTRELCEALDRPQCEMTGMMQGYHKAQYLRREKSLDPVTNRKSYAYSVTAYGKDAYAKLHRRIMSGQELNRKKSNPAHVDRYINAFFSDGVDLDAVKKLVDAENAKFRDMYVTEPINFNVDD